LTAAQVRTEALKALGLPADAGLHEVLGFSAPPFSPPGLEAALKAGVHPTRLRVRADDELDRADEAMAGIKASFGAGTDPVSLQVLNLLQSARAEFSAAYRDERARIDEHVAAKAEEAARNTPPSPARLAALAAMNLGPDATDHQILGLGPDAKRTELGSARADRMREFHPDKSGGTEEGFKLVSEVITQAFMNLRKAAAAS
jgi:hypothetical protein